MNEKLYEWLTKEIDKRGWSNNEFGRRAGVSSSAVSLILNGQRKTNANFCISAAHALDVEPEMVLRLAGILPPTPAGLRAASPVLEEATRIMARLRPELQHTVLLMIRGLEKESEATQTRDVQLVAEPERITSIVESISDEEQQAIHILQSLSPERRSAALDILLGLARAISQGSDE